MRKQRALGEEMGFARGKEVGLTTGEAIGEAQASRRILIHIVRSRFPALAELAQRKAERMNQVAAIEEITVLLATISDETIAREILSAPSAA